MKNTTGSFANIKETQAALRESIDEARKRTEQSERLLAKHAKRKDARRS